MSITFDEALAATANVRNRRCVIGRTIDTLDEDQQAQVKAAMASSLPHAHLARALALLVGHKVDQNAVNKHRKGGCCGS